MRQATFLLASLLAACGGGGSDEIPEKDSRPTVQTADLTGLYVASGQRAHRSRMCMISNESGVAAFGLVIVTPNGSCSGAGEATRTENLLRLTMAGEGECAIEATIEGIHVTMPSAIPAGCAYYCGAGASFAGERFEKTGGTVEDAMGATDLAGDPLCG